MRWRNMKLEPPSIDGPTFFAVSDTEIALVWFAPDMGATWAVMNLPGRGIRISPRSLYPFHSWCPVYEWHEDTNKGLRPEYYGLTKTDQS